MKPSNILHLIHSLDPRHGGPPEVVRQLVSASMEVGANVEIISQDDESSSYLDAFPCKVHAVGSARSTFAYSKALSQSLRRNVARFDGLIIHGIWQYMGIAGANAARGRIPYFVFAHGALDPWFKKQYPLKHVKKCLYWPIQYEILRRANGVLFTGESECEQASASFWPNRWKSRIVPLGIKKPPVKSEKQKEAFFSLLPQLRGQRYLLYLARIHEKKGCDMLVTAFAELANLYPDISLVVAGPDQNGLQKSLRAMAKAVKIDHRISWPGMLTGDAKYGAYLSAEAFILPSHQENFGIAVIEALACGVPVLITDKVEIWPQIKRDLAGLIEEDTVEGTTRLLRSWLSMSPQSRGAIAANAVGCFETNFSIKRTTDAIEDLFATTALKVVTTECSPDGALLDSRSS